MDWGEFLPAELWYEIIQQIWDYRDLMNLRSTSRLLHSYVSEYTRDLRSDKHFGQLSVGILSLFSNVKSCSYIITIQSKTHLEYMRRFSWQSMKLYLRDLDTTDALSLFESRCYQDYETEIRNYSWQTALTYWPLHPILNINVCLLNDKLAQSVMDLCDKLEELKNLQIIDLFAPYHDHRTFVIVCSWYELPLNRPGYKTWGPFEQRNNGILETHLVWHKE